MNTVVAIGGTGQMVVHYMMQLYLLGLIEHSFNVIVVDTDEPINSVTKQREFLEILQYGSRPSDSIGEEIPTIATRRINAGNFQSAAHKLTGAAAGLEIFPNHPSTAFFSSDALTQNLMSGLFARPALSALIQREALDHELMRPQANSTVVVVGSVLGGTGGGMTSPLADRIWDMKEKEGINPLMMRAVLFGEYFRPKDIIDQSVARMKSNQTLVLRSIKEALSPAQSFCIIGGPGVYDSILRDPEKEKTGRRLEWPKKEEEPFWRGTMNVIHFLLDSVSDTKPVFEARETSGDDFPVELDRASESLKVKIRLVDEFVSRRVITKVSDDFLGRRIWGGKLADLISHYWEIAARCEGSKSRVSNFPSLVQDQLETLWNGEKGSGLRDVFPDLTGLGGVKPGEISRIRWPEVRPEQRNRDLFTGTQETARKLAAAIIFFTLRRGY